MRLTIILCTFLLAILKVSVSGQQDPDNMITYEENFIRGVSSYAQEKWSNTIAHIGYDCTLIGCFLT